MHKNKLCKARRKSKTTEDELKYRKYRKVFCVLAKRAEASYYKELLDHKK